MKCQNLFSGKSKKNCINLSSSELAQRVVKVKWNFAFAPSLINESQHERTCLLMCTHKEDSDQDAHLHSLIGAYIVRMKQLCILGYPKYTNEYSDQTAKAQPYLNLCRAYMSKGKVSDVAAQIRYH